MVGKIENNSPSWVIFVATSSLAANVQILQSNRQAHSGQYLAQLFLAAFDRQALIPNSS